MTFVITEPCIGTIDQSCVSVCPVDCIHFEEGTDQMLYINPAECIDCGACQPACPVSAIFPESDVPQASAKFIEINSLWYDDAAAARAMVPDAAAAAGVTAAPAGAPAPAAAAPPATAPAATAASDEPAATTAAVEEPTAGLSAAEAPSPVAAPVAAAAPPPPERRSAPAGTYKYGEAGVEGKCAICGQYVIKGGTPFRKKSVLCPDCAKKQPTFQEPVGRR